jgi:hypothetical protein
LGNYSIAKEAHGSSSHSETQEQGIAGPEWEIENMQVCDRICLLRECDWKAIYRTERLRGVAESEKFDEVFRIGRKRLPSGETLQHIVDGRTEWNIEGLKRGASDTEPDADFRDHHVTPEEDPRVWWVGT